MRMSSTYNGRSRQGENMLRVLHFDHPEWTPVLIGFLPACRVRYGSALDEVILSHPRVFPNYTPPATPPVLNGLMAGGRIRDCWGCVWENLHPGIIGQVVGHPLADWAAFDSWTPPNPMTEALLGPRNWEAVAAAIRHRRERGDFAPIGVLEHGFHYLRLIDLRGFENIMLDMATDEPRLQRLVEIVIDYNHRATQECLDLGAEFYTLAEDLGNQHSLPISLEMFRRYVKPGYEATAGLARDRGVPVFLHSDGHILPLIDDLIEVGVRMLNPQVGANGLEGLREKARGRIAICLDLDRQLFPFAAPAELRAHVREAHDALALPEGGLLFIHALCEELEDVCRLPDPEPGHPVSIGF
jgi:hypothetical protein